MSTLNPVLLSELYLNYSKRMFLIAYHETSDQYLSEDIVQETFLTALEHQEVLSHHPNPVGWLINTEKNILRDEKKKADRLAVFCQKQTQAHAAFTEEPTTPLSAYLTSLSDSEANLILAKYVYQYSYKEISEATGISAATVRKRVERAKKKIKDQNNI